MAKKKLNMNRRESIGGNRRRAWKKGDLGPGKRSKL